MPSVHRDLHELVDAGLELLVARPLEPLAQDRDDLAPRAAVDEDDEAEAEPLLVGAVQLGELGEHAGIVVGALLGRASAPTSRLRADRRVRVEHLLLLVVAERAVRPSRACPSGSSSAASRSTKRVRPSNSSASCSARQLPR